MSADTETTKPDQNDRYRGLIPFKPGQSGNPAGRPKGSRHRFSERFVGDFLKDWEQHGVAVIEKVREAKPDVYLRTATAILPKVSDDADDDFNDLTPEELDERLADLEARTVALLGAKAEAGGTGKTAAEPN
jgi:hypothetical protein